MKGRTDYKIVAEGRLENDGIILYIMVAIDTLLKAFVKPTKNLHHKKWILLYADFWEKSTRLTKTGGFHPIWTLFYGEYVYHITIMWHLLLFSRQAVSGSLQPPWTAACQASMPLTISWSLPKFTSIEPVMPSVHLICHPLLLLVCDLTTVK